MRIASLLMCPLQIIHTPLRAKLEMPNPDRDAQWFLDTSLGIFFHWGIHSVIGVRPSCDMISHYKYGGKVSPPDKYYALAEQFNPQEYDPGKWLKAAKDDGFTYAVLTTKHYDGYALWSSKYSIGTKQYIKSRDLLKLYADACHKNDLKVVFYFSPCDWHYPGFMHLNEYDADKWHNVPPGIERSNVMITSRGNVWYLHLLPHFTRQVSLKTEIRPKGVILLRTGQPVPFSYWEGFIKFNLPPDWRTEIDDVVKVHL